MHKLTLSRTHAQPPNYRIRLDSMCEKISSLLILNSFSPNTVYAHTHTHYSLSVIRTYYYCYYCYRNNSYMIRPSLSQVRGPFCLCAGVWTYGNFNGKFMLHLHLRAHAHASREQISPPPSLQHTRDIHRRICVCLCVYVCVRVGGWMLALYTHCIYIRHVRIPSYMYNIYAG